MFMVRVEASHDNRYRPLTVDTSQYLYEFASSIARSIPDAEVHAHLGEQLGDEVVFRGQDLADDNIDLF